jgi:hypothetical protein
MRIYRKFLVLFLVCFASLFAKETDLLVVLFDAGETNALLPVLEKLHEEGRIFSIAVCGTAAELVKKRPEFSEHLLEIDSRIDKTWTRDQMLLESRILEIKKKVQPKVVLTGVASQIQAQLLDAYKHEARTLAYWDNFSPNGANPYFTKALEVQKHADKVLYPSDFVASAEEFASRPKEEKIVVGQPSLDVWKKELSAVNRHAIWKSPDSVITYIGSYGPEYEEALRLFVRCIRESHFPGKVIIQLHPKSDGAFEKTVCSGAPFLFLPLSTIEAVAIADLVVCYNSTVAFQASFSGKKVLYVIPEKDPYTNFSIENGSISKVHSPEGFAKEWKKKDLRSPRSFEVPENARDKILSVLSAEMSRGRSEVGR